MCSFKLSPPPPFPQSKSLFYAYDTHTHLFLPPYPLAICCLHILAGLSHCTAHELKKVGWGREECTGNSHPAHQHTARGIPSLMISISPRISFTRKHKVLYYTNN